MRRFVDSTPGTVLLDEPLGSRGTVAGTAKTRTFGSFTACAFLEQQGDDPLFAFLRGHAPLHDVFPSRDCDETEPQEDAHAAA